MAAMAATTACFVRPTAVLRRRAPAASPSGLGGVLPARRATVVRASGGSRRLSVSAVSTPMRPGPESIDRVRPATATVCRHSQLLLFDVLYR